jgi:ketosteroid isomerase-like protein
VTDAYADLAATVAAHADRLAIARVLAEFCARVDEYDIAGLNAVFTEDCEVDYGPGRGGPKSGRAAVTARIAEGQAQFLQTHHQLGQSIVDLDVDTARAVTYVTAWHRERDETVSEVRLRYLDDLRRTDEGWRIARRHVQASGIVGFEGVPWTWVPRGTPVRAD